MPMSPSAAAPSSASVMACSRMSASECPSSPNSEGIVTPPRISGRPGAMRCTSQPRPSAKLAQDAIPRAPVSSARNSRARSMSVGLVILMLRSLPCTTLTSTSSRRSTRLDSSVPVKPSSPRAFERALQQIEAEHLRRLRQHQVLARQRLANLVLVDPLHGVHRHDADDRRAGLRRLRRSPSPPARNR